MARIALAVLLGLMVAGTIPFSGGWMWSVFALSLVALLEGSE